MKKLTILAILAILLSLPSLAQERRKTGEQHVQKRYNIFFRINRPEIDRSFKDNARTLDQMQADITTTLEQDGAVPDSLLILSTASPDGSVKFNRWLAAERAKSTEKYLLEAFPQFKDATIIVEYLEEDWDGLKQVLLAHPEFPQREEMLAIINNRSSIDNKEKALRACKQGWRYLVNNYIHALRNSSITISVIGPLDEYVREIPLPEMEPYTYTPHFTAAEPTLKPNPPFVLEDWRKMILGVRSNILVPGLNVGLEFPIKDNWSIGVDYYYPWAVSKYNKWCGEMLGLFVDTKYWLPGSGYEWTRTERLQGHAFGAYAGVGYYDYQNINKGAQGEYIDFGLDYTFSRPIFDDTLLLQFNIGVGMIRTWYRPYHPSSDYEDLIKEPGVKYHATSFFGPTRASVSVVLPIIVKTKAPRAYRTGGNR